MEIEKNKDTLLADRYCPMCRHVCTSGYLSSFESDFPRGRGLLLYNIYKGYRDYDTDTVTSIYNCLLCGTCAAYCEGGYKPHELVKSSRIDIVNSKRAPKIVGEMKNSIIDNENPFGLKESRFFKSVEKKEADVLYYMGHDIRIKNHEIAEAVLFLLDKLKINHTVLRDEPDCGKILKLLGFIGEAKEKAEKLYKRIKGVNPKLILISDPLAYDAFKNDYLQFGFPLEPSIKIMHFSEYAAQLIKDGHLKLSKSRAKITLADSEYLGRFNGVFDPPRFVLQSSAGNNFVEMRFNRDKCLATGESAFIFNNEPFPFGKRLGERICSMAEDAGAEKIVTLSAPAKNNIQEYSDQKAVDIAEFVVHALLS